MSAMHSMREAWVPTLMAGHYMIAAREDRDGDRTESGSEFFIDNSIAVFPHLEYGPFDLRNSSEGFGNVGLRLQNSEIGIEPVLGQ
jgi:hypothetical protein